MAVEFTDPGSLSRDAHETGNVFAPKFDAEGLILAVVSEAATNQVLMVAHMNRQALGLTLASGTVHYYSRSRAALWKKGEISGETQKLIEMRTDCDQDVLLLKVELAGRGAACHTGHKSCFFRKVEAAGDGKVGLNNDAGPPLFDPDEVYRR